MGTLQNQVAVVTGASSGIGRAIAEALAGQGAMTCLVGRNPQTLQSVAQVAAVAAGVPARCYVADFDADHGMDGLLQQLARELPRVDVLVHAAGVVALSSVEDAAPASLDWHYRTNVRAPYLLTQALLPALKASRGQVVFLNSSAGLTARAGAGAYAASKHALKAVADSIRDEVTGAGVRVLSLFLGRTATAGQQLLYESEGRDYRPELLMQPADVASVVAHALALPRTAEITEISMRPLLKSY